MQNSGGGAKIFLSIFMGYENFIVWISWGMKFFFGILEFHSAPVPGIKTDRSLTPCCP